MKWMLWAVVACCGCSTPKGGNRLDVKVENRTERPVRLKVGSGIFSRTIELAPGQTGVYWIDKRWPCAEAVVVIEK